MKLIEWSAHLALNCEERVNKSLGGGSQSGGAGSSKKGGAGGLCFGWEADVELASAGT